MKDRVEALVLCFHGFPLVIDGKILQLLIFYLPKLVPDFRIRQAFFNEGDLVNLLKACLDMLLCKDVVKVVVLDIIV